MSKERSPYGDSINDFELGEKIGHGGFAEVFIAKCKKAGFKHRYVAIKKINKNLVAKRKCKKRIQNEIEINRQLSKSPYPAVLQCFTSFEDEEYWYLVLELCTETFEKYLKRHVCLPEEEAVMLIKQVLMGVQFLHCHHIMHRDLSLRNILLTDKHEVKIADFGLAMKFSHFSDKTNTVLGTANFMSPEIVNHEPYNYKTDSWSVGCVLYSLLYGSAPFKDNASVKHFPLTFPHFASIEAQDLLKSLLNKNPNERIDMTKALKSDLLKKYNQTSDSDIYESREHKNGDSGLSSLRNSCSKKSRSTYTSAEHGNGSKHHRPQKERKSRHVRNAPIAKSQDNSSGFQDAPFQESQNSLSFGSQTVTGATRSSHLNSPSFVSQNITSPALPSHFNSPSFVSQNITSTALPSHQNSPSFFSQNITSSALPSHQNPHSFVSQNPHSFVSQNITSAAHPSHQIPHNFVSQNITSAAHPSHQIPHNFVSQNITSAAHPSHQIPHNFVSQNITSAAHPSQFVNNRQMRSDASSSLGNFTSARNTAVENCSKNTLDPLNTTRLSCRRKDYNTKNLVVSILSDGKVCLEYYKLKKAEKYVHLVYYISGNGLEITIYKPKKRILLNPDQTPLLPHNEHEDELQYFTFENLPNIYWKKYRLAKVFVDSVRGFTPKVIIYGEHAACIMMENTPNPNFEMNFYNGYQITESRSEKTIKDKNGCEVTNNDNYFMEREFEKMKEKCRKIENFFEKTKLSNFPIVGGKKPDKQQQRIATSDNNRENIPPSSNAVSSNVRQCIITIAPENSGLQNTCPKSTSTPYSSEKSTGPSTNANNIPSHLKRLEMNSRYIIAEYEDDVQMWISWEDYSSIFIDSKTQLPFPSTEFPYLRERFKNDSQDILRWALEKLKT